MMTLTGPWISAPSFGSTKNTLPLVVSFFPHPMTKSLIMHSTRKCIRLQLRIVNLLSSMSAAERALPMVTDGKLTEHAIYRREHPCHRIELNAPSDQNGTLS